MSAVASTIFKIRAHSDYISDQKNAQVLSFRKGQPFYALATDYVNGYYFVSTQFAVPFSRTSVSGLVPISKFDRVDLMSKDIPIQKTVTKKPVSQPASMFQQSNPQSIPNQQTMTVPDWKNLFSEPVVKVEVISVSNSNKGEIFGIKVQRRSSSHIISRTRNEVDNFQTYCLRKMPFLNDFAIAINQNSLEWFLNNLITVTSSISLKTEVPLMELSLANFFNPRDVEEYIGGQVSSRRDSGMSVDSVSNKQLNEYLENVGSGNKNTKSIGARLSMMVFGS